MKTYLIELGKLSANQSSSGCRVSLIGAASFSLDLSSEESFSQADFLQALYSKDLWARRGNNFHLAIQLQCDKATITTDHGTAIAEALENSMRLSEIWSELDLTCPSCLSRPAISGEGHWGKEIIVHLRHTDSDFRPLVGRNTERVTSSLDSVQPDFLDHSGIDSNAPSNILFRRLYLEKIDLSFRYALDHQPLNEIGSLNVRGATDRKAIGLQISSERQNVEGYPHAARSETRYDSCSVTTAFVRLTDALLKSMIGNFHTHFGAGIHISRVFSGPTLSALVPNVWGRRYSASIAQRFQNIPRISSSFSTVCMRAESQELREKAAMIENLGGLLRNKLSGSSSHSKSQPLQQSSAVQLWKMMARGMCRSKILRRVQPVNEHHAQTAEICSEILLTPARAMQREEVGGTQCDFSGHDDIAQPNEECDENSDTEMANLSIDFPTSHDDVQCSISVFSAMDSRSTLGTEEEMLSETDWAESGQVNLEYTVATCQDIEEPFLELEDPAFDSW